MLFLILQGIKMEHQGVRETRSWPPTGKLWLTRHSHKENWHLRQLLTTSLSLSFFICRMGMMTTKIEPSSRGLSRKCNDVQKSAWPLQHYISQVETSYETIFQGSTTSQVVLVIDLYWPSEGWAPRFDFWEVSESVAPERKYWPLGLLVHKLSYIYKNIRFATSKYTFKPILGEKAYY